MCSPAALILPVYLIVAMGGFRAMSGFGCPPWVEASQFAAVQMLVSKGALQDETKA
jgi:hypothetical protein